MHTAHATLVLVKKHIQFSTEIPSEESDDELLLTSLAKPKLLAKYKHFVIARPQTSDSDDELDFLPKKTHRGSVSTRRSGVRVERPKKALKLQAPKADTGPSTHSTHKEQRGPGYGAEETCTDAEILLHSREVHVIVRPTGFLDLPPEAILLCLWNLPFEDIERCRTLNRQIYRLISGSLHMRYRAKQDRAGMEENHYAFQGQSWSIPERISKLHDLEKRWLEFRPTVIYQLNIKHTDFPQVTADYFLAPYRIGGELRGVRYIQTSGSDELETTFTLVDFVKPLVAFGAAIEEHDLIAAVHLYVLLHFFPLTSHSYILEHFGPIKRADGRYAIIPLSGCTILEMLSRRTTPFG